MWWKIVTEYTDPSFGAVTTHYVVQAESKDVAMGVMIGSPAFNVCERILSIDPQVTICAGRLMVVHQSVENPPF